jgi:hypothetical protein
MNRNEYQESSWGKERPARKTDNLTAICESVVQKMLKPRRLTNLWTSTAFYRDSFTLSVFKFVVMLLSEHVFLRILILWL